MIWIVNFLLNRSYGAVFCVCAENTADNTGIFSYVWAALTQSHGLLCSSSPLNSKEAGAAQGVGRGHSQGTLPQLTKGTIPNCSICCFKKMVPLFPLPRLILGDLIFLLWRIDYIYVFFSSNFAQATGLQILAREEGYLLTLLLQLCACREKNLMVSGQWVADV